MLSFLIGVMSGMLGGMGIGGGSILIPALTIILRLDQHTAQSINLISFIPASIIALIYHFKKDNIERKIIKPLIAIGILGAITGSFIALLLKQNILRKIFGVFLFTMGVFEILSSKHKKNK